MASATATRMPSRQWLLLRSLARPAAPSHSQLRIAPAASSAMHTSSRHNLIQRTCSSIAIRQRLCKQQLRQRPQIRRYSAPSSPSSSKVYGFEDVKALVEKPSQERILIDVREPAEYSAGHIPTAINIPVNSAPEALFLSSDEFTDRFGFEKPDPQSEVVFYCKAGVRSSAAAKFAEMGGFKHIGEYPGSWLDWVNNGGKEKKP